MLNFSSCRLMESNHDSGASSGRRASCARATGTGPMRDIRLVRSMRNAKRHREIQNDIAGPGQKFEFRASLDANPRPGAAAAANGPPSTQNTSKLPPLVHCRCPRPSWTNARPRGCACWAPLGSGGISGPGPWSGNRDVLKFPMDPGSWIPPNAAPCSTGSIDR